MSQRKNTPAREKEREQLLLNCSLSFSRIHFSLLLQGFINETRGIRPPDTLIKSQVLYRLS